MLSALALTFWGSLADAQVLSPVPIESPQVTAATISEKPSPGAWPDHVFTWHYNPQHAPAWLSAEAAQILVQRAAEPWAACGVQMQFAGITYSLPGKIDRTNVVGWSLEMPRQLRGLTLGQAKAGRLLERDVLIRPDRKEFQLYPRLLQKVITHEFGHAIGLTHSSRCDDVMTLAADCPKVHPRQLPIELTPHDLARCHAIYPPQPNEIKSTP